MEGDFSVGVILDVSTFGQAYIDRFYPNSQFHAESIGSSGPPSLLEYMNKRQLWVEIVVPSSENSPSSGKSFNAKVLGSCSANPNTIYITSPICCLDIMKPCFPSVSLTDGTALGSDLTCPSSSGKYNAYDGKIAGFDAATIKPKIESSGSTMTRDIVVTPSASRVRVRFWIDKNAKGAAGVPAEMFERNYNNSAAADSPASISQLTNTSTGAPMPINANPAEHVDIAIDCGHTTDKAREHPSAFSVDWNTGISGEIAALLSFTKTTNDSVEHLLNCKLGQAASDALTSRGMKVGLFDFPEMANGAEITKTAKSVMLCSPKVFVSIHNNAAGTGNWKSLGAGASGTVGVHSTPNGALLAKAITDKINMLRSTTNGPNNRKGNTSQENKGLGILNGTSGVAYSCLIEVGFYDNAEDLKWMASHIREIGDAIGDSIISFMQSNA